MSPGEVCWRLGGKLQESADLCLLPFRGKLLGWTRPTGVGANGDGRWVSPAVLGLGQQFPTAMEDLPAAAEGWRTDLIRRADRLCENRLTLFDLSDHYLGEQIDWNYEYAAGKRTPVGFAPHIDYRDYSRVGDAKLVWGPNRHHHLVVLGRAYRLTGRDRYARAVLEQMDGWIRQCPYGLGMNWRSPLELAIRLINWAWALELIRPSGLVSRERAERILPAVYRHLWEISRKYSRHSSANNHLVGEAAGVFIGSSYCSALRNSEVWRKESKEILLREILEQSHPDGGHRELAMGYHLFVMEFFLLAGLAARNAGDEFPPCYWERLERMFDFLAAFAEGGEQLPMFGDSDDGYVVDFASQGGDFRELLAVGAALFERADLKELSKGAGEATFWLLGRDGHERLRRIPAASTRRQISSRAFPDTGYYLLQCGHRNEVDRLSVTFDCGDLGFGPLAAHGHADALSFTLRAFGREVFVDPGTYDYFTDRRWRDYFRGTRAHNTVVVDGQDQSQMLGLFLWGRRAEARCLRWEPCDAGGTVVGEHDGYSGLAGGVTHRRSITLDGERREVLVRDELRGSGRHEGSMYLHLSEHCRVWGSGAGRFTINCGKGEVVLSMDPRLTVRSFAGCDDPIMGWVSRGYHQKTPSTTLVGSCEWSGHLCLETRIWAGPAPAG